MRAAESRIDSSNVPIVVTTNDIGFLVPAPPTHMGLASSGLKRLRPVVFRYRSEPNGQQHYGLIAEEVARV
jgi:hypothetical protein